MEQEQADRCLVPPVVNSLVSKNKRCLADRLRDHAMDLTGTAIES